MKDTIVTRGKTIQEAIQKAANHYQVPEDEIEYEVVRTGRRNRVFIIRSAVIEARRKTPSIERFDAQPSAVPAAAPSATELVHWVEPEHIKDISTFEETITEGTVWVSNNRVFCKNGTYHYARIKPARGVLVRLNGQVVDTTTVVSEEDVIDVELQHETVEPQMKLTVSEDRMHVYLDVVPGYRVMRQLKDCPPRRELILEVQEVKQIVNGITELQVLQDLKKLGVKFGIDLNEIKRACSAQEPVTCVVAQGIKPMPGKDAEFEPTWLARKQHKDVLSISDKIDWREQFSLPTVKAGEVIGRVIPATAGVPGTNVFNQEVFPEPPKELTLVAQRGTALYEGGNRIVAIESGRIVVQKRSGVLNFSVLPQYVHRGDVNMKTGNIRFHGDVYILGNIEEGVTVECGGNLHVTGTVAHCVVITGGDVFIHGAAVGANIICGRTNFLWDTILPTFRSIHEDLIDLIAAIKQLEMNRSFSKVDLRRHGLQPLLKLLLEVKFKDLPARIRQISESIKQEKQNVDPDLEQIVDFMEKAFLYFHPLVTNLAQLESLSDFMMSVISSIEFDSNKRMNIKAQSLTNCVIKSGWNVAVERFCYGSDVLCRGGMRVDGILRGGRVEAGEFIEVNEIGSNSGAQTIVAVSRKDGYITAEIVGMDTLIRISNLSKRTHTMEISVRAHIDSEGNLKLS
ncbi:flagellar assembly protein A [Alicyclobacillus acidoterrestris]|uniref:FapA family protein n=2 Tax=Alicyclobacillus TaxID=29330 RepID=T0BKM0_ALIAG|nr:FapA family protein [Alicyclobacillus acidoterrestris]EPZ44518.1 hypothetical protein N007_10895 [Alicyclobacillus acidoterrestris ATCC 49025]UNO49554.1 FapA family protein [Alicyclobacillus acidoterrestris]